MLLSSAPDVASLHKHSRQFSLFRLLFSWGWEYGDTASSTFYFIKLLCWGCKLGLSPNQTTSTGTQHHDSRGTDEGFIQATPFSTCTNLWLKLISCFMGLACPRWTHVSRTSHTTAVHQQNYSPKQYRAAEAPFQANTET